jgi:hypothetical protein
VSDNVLYASGSMSDLLLDELSPDAPKLLGVISGIAVGKEAGSAQGTQATNLLAGVVEEGRIGTSKQEVVQRADDGNV